MRLLTAGSLVRVQLGEPGIEPVMGSIALIIDLKPEVKGRSKVGTNVTVGTYKVSRTVF